MPVSKLSKSDQEFLEGGSSPFEMVDAGDSPADAGGSAAAVVKPSDTAATSTGSVNWSSAGTVDWETPRRSSSR